MDRQDESCNIPFTVGDPLILWNKVMDEVAVNRFAGPFNENSLH